MTGPAKRPERACGRVLPHPAHLTLCGRVAYQCPGLADEKAATSLSAQHLEDMTPQACPKGIHADWAVDSELDHACPWCRVAELEAERHSTNEALSKADEALRAKDDRITRLEDALAAAGKSLSAFIFDSSDPGSDALGAQWLVRQVMPQVDDPFAQPRAFRASVFEEAAKAIEGLDRASDDDHRKRTQAYLDGYEDGICAAAEHMNLMADRAAEGRDQS